MHQNEAALNEADKIAMDTTEPLSHDEVFGTLREMVKEIRAESADLVNEVTASLTISAAG